MGTIVGEGESLGTSCRVKQRAPSFEIDACGPSTKTVDG